VNCPLPRKSQIITAAGPRLTCEKEPKVLADMPVKHNQTGQESMQFISICLDHAIDLAIWKLLVKLGDQQNGSH
jgi:hypothetical protein